MNSNDAEQWRNEWIPLSVAAQEVHVSVGKISRLVKNRKFQTQTNPYDERQVLVQRQAVYEYFRKPIS
jgi:hypothetical protein